jgi:hypothetical protein
MHLVVIKQLLFAHVGLPNLFTFYWLSATKGVRVRSSPPIYEGRKG